MSGRAADGVVGGGRGLKYAQASERNTAESLTFSSPALGQRNPQHCPHPDGGADLPFRDVLGDPMTIREVARMFGCSAWTIRQRYLPIGLPYFRLRPTGKLLFFHNQIVRWVLAEQRRKGGIRP